MSNVTYLHDWNPDLCIQLETADNHRADFNRFLVKHFPTTESMQQGKDFEHADREGFILQLKARFVEAIEEGGSHRHLYGLFFTASQYLRWCDKAEVEAFTQSSVEGYMSHLNERVMLGQLKNSSYKRFHSSMMTLFTQYLDLPRSYFNSIVVRGNGASINYVALSAK